MKIMLNKFKVDNFMFSDVESGVYVNLVSPFAVAKKSSKALEIAIRAGKIIDIDNKLNIEVSEDVKPLNDYCRKMFGIEALGGKEKVVKEEKVEVVEKVIENERETVKENKSKKEKIVSKKNKK